MEQLKCILKRQMMMVVSNATCWLPEYKWENISGYSESQIEYFKHLLRNNAHLIIEFSQEGGLLNAANS